MTTAIAEHTSNATRDTQSRGDATTQYVTFYIDRQLLGIPVEYVQEVLNPQTVAVAPRARQEIAGLINLRGQIVTAVDLRIRLNLPHFEGESMNVVITDHQEAFSLLVDQVGDVIDLADSEVMSVPPTLNQHWKQITKGVSRLEKELLIVLNVQNLLSF
jgi:purine-binding chemotaxis protein CheW